MKVPIQQPPIELASNHTVDDRSSSLQLEHEPAIDKVPNGGYGWIVVSACSLITAFYLGGFYSWGIFQAGLANENFAQDSTLAFIGSLAVSWVAIGAVPNSWILHWLSSRNTAVVSCFLLGFDQILNGFTAKNIGGLFFTNGIIVGLGNSLCFLACGTLPSQWFKRRRGLANGLVIAGGGFGGCIQCIAMQILIDRLGIIWTFRIMGLVTVTKGAPDSCYTQYRLVPSFFINPTMLGFFFRSLSKDPKFVLLFLGSGLATFPLLVPPFFIPMYASSLNISGYLASVLLAVFNIASAVGRVELEHFCDVVGPLSSLSVAILLSGTSMLVVWPESNSLTLFIVLIFINGLGNGGFFATMPTVVAHVYGSRVGVAFAMIVTSWSVGYLMGAPIAAWILESHSASVAS